MSTVVDLLNRVKKTRSDIDFIAENSIDTTKKAIIDSQKDQLLHGLRGDGQKIGKYKNQKYAAKKFNMNPLAGFGNVDLKLTGEFQKEIFVDVRSDIFIIDSTDPKTARLIDRYTDPFGLMKDNQAAYVDESLQPEFMKEIKESLGL